MRDKLIAIAAISLGSVVFAEINEDVVVVHESKFQPMADMVESANETLLEVHHSMKEICDERLESVAIMWEMYDDFWEDRYINGVNGSYQAGYDDGYDKCNEEDIDSLLEMSYWKGIQDARESYLDDDTDDTLLVTNMMDAIDGAISLINTNFDADYLVCWDGEFTKTDKYLYNNYRIIDSTVESCNQ